MKAMLINAYGENAVFETAEVEKPELKAGHVLIEIAASSVNTVDTMIRKMGKDLPLSPDTPAILGMDFAGTVRGVGEGVEGYSVGDEVYGCAGGLADLPGTLAEYIVADIRSGQQALVTLADAALSRSCASRAEMTLPIDQFVSVVVRITCKTVFVPGDSDVRERRSEDVRITITIQLARIFGRGTIITSIRNPIASDSDTQIASL